MVLDQAPSATGLRPRAGSIAFHEIRFEHFAPQADKGLYVRRGQAGLNEMSRFRKYAHSLVSGYVVLGANMLYTLASVPLALKYLGKPEFGLWALTSQIAGYIARSAPKVRIPACPD